MFGSSNITVGDFTGRPTDASPAVTALALVVDPATDTMSVIELQNIPATSGQNRLRTVIARVDNTAAPPTEVEGDRYLLDDTGASHANWDGAAANDVVQFTSGSWVATSPVEGFVVYSDGSNTDWLYVDDGTPDWTERAVASTDHGSLSGLTDDDHTQYLLGDGTRAGTGLQEFLGLNLTDSTELTIASGAVTATQGYHTIDTESDAATDDLDTITVAGGEGDILILRAESSARTVVIKHGTGNIQCAEGYDLSLDSDYDYATLVRKDGTNWMAFSGARRMPPYLDNGDTLGGALAGDIYYNDGTTVTNLRKGSDDQILKLQSGLPSWEDEGGGGGGSLPFDDGQDHFQNASDATRKVRIEALGVQSNATAAITPRLNSGATGQVEFDIMRTEVSTGAPSGGNTSGFAQGSLWFRVSTAPAVYWHRNNTVWDAIGTKMMLDGTAAPGTGDDADDGYSPGSIWVDTTNDDAYICVDNTSLAAVWKQITP